MSMQHSESEIAEEFEKAFGEAPQQLKLSFWKRYRKKILIALGGLSLIGMLLAVYLMLAHSEDEEQKDPHASSSAAQHAGQSSHTAAPAAPVTPSMADSKILEDYVRLLAENGRYVEAARHAEKLSYAAQRNANLSELIGRVFLFAGKSAEAKPHLLNASKLNPSNPELQAMLGLSEVRSKHIDSGMARLNKIVQNFPSDLRLKRWKAEAWMSLGKHEDVLKELSPHLGDPEIALSYAKALLALDRCPEALPLLERVTRQDPLNGASWAKIGYCLHLKRDAQGAESAYLKALQLLKEDYNTLYNYGSLMYDRANASDDPEAIRKWSESAAEKFLAAVAIQPEHPEAHFKLGNVLAFARQHHEAIEHYLLAAQVPRFAFQAHVQISASWMALGEKDLASKALDSAAKADGANPLLKQRRALLATWEPEAKVQPAAKPATAPTHSTPQHEESGPHTQEKPQAAPHTESQPHAQEHKAEHH